ncbi:MAG: toxin-antitoxin system protein [Ruminococcus sp.]|nr:toxin-antitoxin system protein [Ruminococcus sp.]
MAFSIRLTEQERELAESYARLHSISVGEAFKQALFERIEDEFDLKVFEEALEEYEKNPVTYSFEDMKKELGL